MVHITCDLCGKELHPGQDHYVVKIELFVAAQPAPLTEADLDEDHMEAVGELLQEMEDSDDLDVRTEPTCKNFRYDLCPDCQKRFARNPLNREAAQKVHFSEN
jgi:hypothetical protein